MPSSGMLHRVSLVRTDVSEVLYFSETSVLTRAKLRNVLEDGILHSHRSENLKILQEINGGDVRCTEHATNSRRKCWYYFRRTLNRYRSLSD
jgi:hypothetical protein